MKWDKFSVKKVSFDGNEHISDLNLLKISNIQYMNNIFSYDMQDIKNKIESVSWIKSTEVQRVFPDKIIVRVSERIPIAILQSNHKLFFVDGDGVILDKVIGNKDLKNLPIIAGENAHKEINSFLRYLNKFPKIKKQLVYAVRIGNRRWNIKINKGIVVKLPERNLGQSLEILEEISNKDGYLRDDIVSLDMRIPGRIIVNNKNIK